MYAKALFGLAALLLLVPGSTARSLAGKYSAWEARNKNGQSYYRTKYSYGQDKYHYAYYYPKYSKRHYYYYNPNKKRYWGRYDLENKTYHMLPENKRTDDFDAIKEDDFEKKGQAITDVEIPGEKGDKLDVPPAPPGD